jgi:hypothetical protein
VFIASAIAVLLTQRRGGSAAAVSTTPAAAGEPARQGQGRKQRRARAS